jgi:sensor histidine kinase YesM
LSQRLFLNNKRFGLVIWWCIVFKKINILKRFLIPLLLYLISGTLNAQSISVSQIYERFVAIPIPLQNAQIIKPLAPLASFTKDFVCDGTLEFSVQNDLSIASTCYFHIGTDNIFRFSSIDMVRSVQGISGVVALEVVETKEVFYNGYLTPILFRQYANNLQVLHIKIQPKQTYTVRFHIFNLTKRHLPQITAINSSGFVDFQERFIENTKASGFVSNLYLGAIVIMAIFMFAIYSQNKIQEFGLYTLYLLTMLFFGILDIYPLHFKDFFGWHFPKYFIHLKESSVYLYLVFYHTFIAHFLKTKTTQKYLYKGFLFINLLYVFLFLTNVTVIFFFYDLGLIHNITWVNTFVFYGSIIFYIYLFVMIWKLKSVPFSRYIFWGSFIFYLSNVLAIYFNATTKGVYLYEIYPNNFIQIGAIVEILFFAIALGRKALMDSEEKNKLQKQVIAQLNEKKELIEGINERLEKDVAEKTEEIFAQTQSLQVEREEKIRLQFGKQLQEMRLYAIQTQLNPHFLFNCLNTIKSLVVNQENQKAAIYLNQFAKLMRSTLENSEKLKINLKESIEYLKNYVEMEKLRFKEDFDFEITFEGEEAPELLQVPPMLIHPFVENAIIHGLVPSKNQKKLSIIFVEQEDFLLCNITDNGKGFNATPKDDTHNSKGLEMIQNYFNLWNSQKNEKATFSIKSKQNKGTDVCIKIPI